MCAVSLYNDNIINAYYYYIIYRDSLFTAFKCAAVRPSLSLILTISFCVSDVRLCSLFLSLFLMVFHNIHIGGYTVQRSLIV